MMDWSAIEIENPRSEKNQLNYSEIKRRTTGLSWPPTSGGAPLGAEIRCEPERRQGLPGTAARAGLPGAAARAGTGGIGAEQVWGERRGCWASELESVAGMEE